MKICLIDKTGTNKHALSIIINRWGLEHEENNPMALVITSSHIELQKRDEPKFKGIFVDFVNGALAYRRRFGNVFNEAIVRSVRIKHTSTIEVLDATAGFGRDAFILASAGFRVRMLERNPVVAILLADGLMRGYFDQKIGLWLRERLQLIYTVHPIEYFNITPRPQVIYLDPMFPNKRKSALVKKEMRVLQALVGVDLDADHLLESACKLATKRVVVKRPRYAPPLAGIVANNNITTKSYRFDIYQITSE